MSNLTRRAVIGTGAAAAALVGANPTAHARPLLPADFTSPRIARLLALAARFVEVEHEHPIPSRMKIHEMEIDALNDQLCEIADEVWETPAPGMLGVVERALVAHAWHATAVGPNGVHVINLTHADGYDQLAVVHLIKAVLDLAGFQEGGANV